MLTNAYNNPNFKPGTPTDILYPGGPFKFRDIAAEGSRLSRILDAEDKLMERRYLGIDAEKIFPHGKAYYPNRENVTLADVLREQHDFLTDLARRDPNMENTARHQLINEIGYHVDPTEIAGIRLPEQKGRMYRGMRDLAEKHNLPIWQFTPQTDPLSAAQGIADYLGGGGGKWYRRKTEEFPMGLVESTADPMAKYFRQEPPYPVWDLPGYRGLEGVGDLPPIEHVWPNSPYKNL